ncbi:CBS domain-containing protein [Pseudodesulfovibrio cashew]|uniref:CBS domain-containing protein n=1 Tax=Pseudodesulfovibrio cashew TaxID=2678688 RepID=A0A6I6JI17_9BACT|nr:CBS domain-containing protein [Pseudodesulfovibrio cashew]QGY39787.1 CBS domain-containing protein [Pseudodesulfovibrio cashew]
MLVRDWMTRNVITLGVNSSVMDAAEILREKNIRQFPVLDSRDKLVGIVSDRDIRDAMPSKFIPGDVTSGRSGGLYTLTAGDIMTTDPITVSPHTSLDEAAEILVKHKIGGLPVLEGRILTGIITQIDILRFLCSVSGSTNSGTRLAFRIDPQTAPLFELLSEIHDMGLTCSNVFTASDGGTRITYIRVEGIGESSVEEVVVKLQRRFKVLFYVNEGITVDVS